MKSGHVITENLIKNNDLYVNLMNIAHLVPLQDFLKQEKENIIYRSYYDIF